MDLSLRPTAEADLDFVLAAESGPEAAPWVTQDPREVHRAAIESADQEHLIVTGPGGERLGYAMLAGVGSVNASLELRRIAVTEPGRGIGREALRLAVERCFAEHGAHRVWLDLKPDNERARRAYSALGFVYEGMLREAIRAGDGWESRELMSVLAHEWAARDRRATRQSDE